jgi:hypothetical protein
MNRGLCTLQGDDPSLVVRAYRGMAPVLKGEFSLLSKLAEGG